MYIKYMADELEDLHLIGTNESGTYKRVYNISRHPVLGSISVRIPTRWWYQGVLTPSTIALVINDRTGMTGVMTTDNIIAEIKTLKQYQKISPMLYGTVWYPQHLRPGLESLYFDGYDTPSTDDLRAIDSLPSASTSAFVVLLMERCLNINDCLDEANFAAGLIAFFSDLLKTYNIFYTDPKIGNICCSNGDTTRYKFRLLDFDPKYIFAAHPDYYAQELYLMALIFMAELPYHLYPYEPYDHRKQIVGQELTKILFDADKDQNDAFLYELIRYAGLHMDAFKHNINTVDAFTTLCTYAYGNTVMCDKYDNAPNKSVVINEVKVHLIQRFDGFFTGGGGGRLNKRRSNKRRLNKRRENKRRSNKNKFKRTKRKLI
jgi:hypothetical protein